MVVVRFWRGLRSIGFRGLSTHGSPEAPSIEPTKKILKSASDPKCCYILGSRGIKQFSVELFIPLAEFLKREPVFTKVPSDRLIAHVDVKKPYLTSEAGRVWIRSGYILPYLCHLQSLSLLNPFTEGNVGILDGFGILCFRKLHLLENFVPDTEDSSLSPVNTVTNSCFTSFLKDMLVEEYNTWSVAPDGLCALMKAADAPLDKEIIYNPELMPDELQATLFQEMQRLVRKQLPTRGLHSKAMGIMQHVHNSTGVGTHSICSGHEFLRQWAYSHFPVTGTGLSALSKNEKKLYKKFLKKMKKGLPTSTLPVASMQSNLVEGLIFYVHRHALAHTVEPPIDKLIVCLTHSNSLATDPHTWRDAVVLLRYMLPWFLFAANRAFINFSVWEELYIEIRFPIPQIYHVPGNVILDSDPPKEKCDKDVVDSVPV